MTGTSTDVDDVPGFANFRDLGGLPTEDTRITRSGVLYRSDAPRPRDLPPDAPSWPPAVVLDLRSSAEWTQAHPLGAGVAVVLPLPLLDDARPPALSDDRAREYYRLSSLYPRMLGRAVAMLPMVLDVVTAAAGPVLVHCAAGKDRTGVLVALLLRVAGVTREAVVADYARTADAMPRLMRRLHMPGVDLTALATAFPDALRAPAYAIEAVLDVLDRHDGGMPGWLHDHAVHPTAVAAWRTRLLA